MATLYLNEDLHPDAFAVGARLPVWGADARHAAQVARVRTGERIGVGDGRGRIGWGPVVHVAQQEVAIEVAELAVDPARRPRLILVQALAKGDRDELAVQAATELGVDVIVPWQAARSVSRWDAKAEKGLARWRTIVREAAKQAHRAWVPEVEGVARLADLVARARTANVFVLEPSAVERLTAVASDPLDDRDVVLVVGPEGGIAPEELDALRTAGARLVRLGDTVLRTSTAGAAAISVLSASTGRW